MILRKTQIVALMTIAVALGALAFVAFGGLDKNLVYYLTPDELLDRGTSARGATVRLGGLVQKDSVQFDNKTLDLTFRVGMLPDGGRSVVVHSTGTPPQMFQPGIGAVVEGQYDGQVFRADRVMVKHSNEYRPPAPGEKPKDMYGTLVPPPTE